MLKKFCLFAILLIIGGAGCSLSPLKNLTKKSSPVSSNAPIANNEEDAWPVHKIYKVQYADDKSYDFFIDPGGMGPSFHVMTTGTYYGEDAKYLYVSHSNFHEMQRIQNNRLSRSAYKYEFVDKRPFLPGSKTEVLEIQPATRDTFSYRISRDHKIAVLSLGTSVAVIGKVTMGKNSGPFMHHENHVVFSYDLTSNTLNEIFDDFELERKYNAHLSDYCPSEFSSDGTYILFGCSSVDERVELTFNHSVYNLKTDKFEDLGEVTKFEWLPKGGYRYKNSVESNCQGHWKCIPDSECSCTKNSNLTTWKTNRI